MQERYLRNIPALSEEECALLQSKKIAIVGCGGLGGHLAELMARIGCRELVLIDGDVFEITNLNRQLYSAPSVLGCYKAETAAVRIQHINPDIHITCHTVFLTADNADILIDGCDIVLDGLDSISARKLLKQACTRNRIPYVFGAISGWVVQVAISMPDDNLIDIIYPEKTQIQDKSALSFTAAFCASMQTALCIKLLIERPVETGTIFYFDLLNQEYEVVPIVT